MKYPQHRTLLVFDIETIPDTDLCEQLTGCPKGLSIEQKRDEMTRYHLNITDGKNSFLRQPFHKIVAISYVQARIKIDSPGSNNNIIPESNNTEKHSFTKVFSEKGETEEAMVRSFFQKLEPDTEVSTTEEYNHPIRLVSFNGRTFDIPVLKYRAMKYGIQIPSIYNTGKSKWDNYNARYDINYHHDLIDSLSDCGASAHIKMHEICTLIGLPGKFGADGSSVMSLYDQGKIQDIKDYCETDVLNTFLIYLRYLHSRGTVSYKCYNYNIEKIIELLQSSGKEHLKEFLDAWKNSCNGEFAINEK